MDPTFKEYVPQTRCTEFHKKKVFTSILFLYFIFIIIDINIIYAQDIHRHSCLSPLTWEEHIFIKEDKSIFSIMIFSFSINNTNQEINIGDVFYNVMIFTSNKVNVYLYPKFNAYEEIDSINILNSDETPLLVPQDMTVISISFNEKILKYRRYSFAILFEILDIIDKKTPFLTGEIYYNFDYTVWVEFSGDNIDDVSTDLFKTIIEGIRFEKEFPRLTVTTSKKITINSITPNEDTRTDGLPYSYGIYQEEKNGIPTVIDTGFIPGLRITKPFGPVEQNETIGFTFYSVPFSLDDEIRVIISDTLWSEEKYHTIGWFIPPSHIYLENFRIDRNRQITDFSIIIGILGFLSIPLKIVWNKYNVKKHGSQASKKRRRRK